MLMRKASTVEEIEFKLIRWKMSNSSNCTLLEEEIDIAIREYKRFLTLRIENPSERISPTRLMDEVWHFHILDTKKYTVDCMNLFGEFMHHNPGYGPFDSNERAANLLESFETMKILYRQRFSENPILEQGSCSNSCGNSSCHGGGVCDV